MTIDGGSMIRETVRRSSFIYQQTLMCRYIICTSEGCVGVDGLFRTDRRQRRLPEAGIHIATLGPT